MKAVTWNELGAQPSLHDKLPEPSPDAGEVLVRVSASSVNPVDRAIAAGMLEDMVPHEFPVTLGRDFAGIVERLGEGVSSVELGDRVFGLLPATGPTVHNGSWADVIAVDEANLTRVPEGVQNATAGAIPLAAVTAILCIDPLDVSPGHTVLMAGATGGVGSVAVQLAAAAGAAVIAPALPEDEDYLRELGVSGSYDAALEDGGRVSSATNAAGDGPGRTNVISSASPAILGRIARHLADGTLTMPIQKTYDLAEAPEALRALGATHTRGKLAVHVNGPTAYPARTATSAVPASTP